MRALRKVVKMLGEPPTTAPASFWREGGGGRRREGGGGRGEVIYIKFHTLDHV